MAGFREFVTGEVLTAANVDDFLMKQSVQKYADAAARDAALGTAVAGGNALREGMVAYLDDTNDVQKYDGSAWASIGAAGIGSNVVVGSSGTGTSTTSTSFVNVTGGSATITLTKADSKVLLLSSANYVRTALSGAFLELEIDFGGSQIHLMTFRAAQADDYSLWAAHLVHTPGSVGPHTYQLRFRTANALSLAQIQGAGGPVTFTAIEVAV